MSEITGTFAVKAAEGRVYTFSGGHLGETIPLLVMNNTARELMRVNQDGEVRIAEDITLEEAKYVIRELAPHALLKET